jgi:glycosyltransferase involved in cell wall biosynthesis
MTYHGEFLPDTGACGAMIAISKQLASAGINVEYYTFSDLPTGLDIRLKSILFPLALWRHVMRHDRWDAIDTATADSWVFAKLGRPRRRPLFILRSDGLEQHAHEAYLTYAQSISWKYWLYWGGMVLWTVDESLRHADHLFVLNERERRYVCDVLGRSSAAVTVAYHALPAHFRGLPPYHPPADFRILYVGTWLERKGVRYLCEALEALLADRIDFSVTLAGLATPETTVRAALSSALNRRTRIIERIANVDLPALYRSHSVYVFPSLYEGFGKTLTEAIACGIPVITTAAGIAPDFVEAIDGGTIVPDRDSAAIHRALRAIHRNPEPALAAAHRARHHLGTLDLEAALRVRLQLFAQHGTQPAGFTAHGAQGASRRRSP